MDFGNKPVDGGNLLLSQEDLEALALTDSQRERFIRPIYGSAEFIRGLLRYCIWIKDQDLQEALGIEAIARRVEAVRLMRLASTKSATRDGAGTAHRFDEVRQTGNEALIAIAAIS